MSSLQLRAMRPRHVFSVLMLASLAACGGGGNNTEPQAQTKSGAQASLAAPASFYWRASTRTQVKLQDAQGQAVAASAITCSAIDATQVEVSANCGSIKPLRIGVLSIAVQGGGASATLTIKAEPVPGWTGAHAASSQSGDATLITLPDGKVLAWGYNPSGQLGLNHRQDQATPALVVADASNTPLTRIASTSIGLHAAFALDRDGQLWAWGTATAPNLGTMDPAYVNGTLLPIRVPGPDKITPLSHVVQIGTGDSHSAALLDDGTVMSWGDFGANGKQGRSEPAFVKAPNGSAKLGNIVAISTGTHHTLGLTAEGQVIAWGWEGANTGTLGTGQFLGTLNSAPALPNVVVKQDGKPLSNIVQVSAGYDASLALDGNGQVWAWGSNSWGQLGAGVSARTGSPYAVPVKINATQPLAGAKMVVAGGLHGMALMKEGRVMGWGRYQEGQIGIKPGDQSPDTLAPQFIASADGQTALTGVASLASGHNHAMAMLEDGQVLTWGAYFAGALGRPSDNKNDPTPRPVQGENGSGQLMLTPAFYPSLTGQAR